MKVYVVLGHSPTDISSVDGRFEAVFATRELAEDYAAEANAKSVFPDFYVETHELLGVTGLPVSA